MTGREAAEKVAGLLGNITADDIMGRSRLYPVAVARQLVMWYLVRVLDFSANKAGEMLGRTHVTVGFGLQQIENIIELNRDYDRKIICAAATLLKERDGLQKHD